MDNAKKQAGVPDALSRKWKQAGKKRTNKIRRQENIGLRYGPDERTEPHITL